jgi:hypothetical protein
MTFPGVILTIIIAVAVGLFFYYAFRTSGPWGRLWTFITILILAGLAGSTWITPVGPRFYDVAWVPAFLVILFAALLLTAATPPTRKDNQVTKAERDLLDKEPAPRVYAVMGLFFYLLVFFLFFAIIYGFLQAI